MIAVVAFVAFTVGCVFAGITLHFAHVDETAILRRRYELMLRERDEVIWGYRNQPRRQVYDHRLDDELRNAAVDWRPRP